MVPIRAVQGGPSFRPRVVVAAGSQQLVEAIFPPVVREELAVVADVAKDIVLDWSAPSARDELAVADVVVSGWGAPRLEEEHLVGAPHLVAVLQAGGDARAAIDVDAAIRRGIALSDAGEDNAQPVAEYTLAAILTAGKDLVRAERLYRERQAFIDREAEFADAGNYGRTVGVVGASRIGRRVLELLRPFDFEVLVADPTITDDDARSLGAELTSLDGLLRRSDTITLHVPVTPETTGMIGSAELAVLRGGATLINTSRGAVVDQDALVEAIRAGRIRAVLDVTEPDPLPAGHPLYMLPGVVLTPHMAGAVGREIARLGSFIVGELSCLTRGEPLRGQGRYASPVSPNTDQEGSQ
ncbi:hydroxyacid dehydrogenase [Arthrobacter sp. CJ23]|uniref:hydroxyacid dehydrogenase n=1 Tax=Arthrobacter sp. CJ23 TaxID=2972479 RepID=UPI00215BB515|nr:hydroxyacid dehydrogenase [Arthrobacter sp. CJ23]UVJ39083.1 hydroxyacid dehydrogenase [Arthrobacter sp. CJ23]